MTKQPGGRPPRDPTGKPARIVQVRLTEAERQRYQEAADRAGGTLSSWIRDRLDIAAKLETKQN